MEGCAFKTTGDGQDWGTALTGCLGHLQPEPLQAPGLLCSQACLKADSPRFARSLLGDGRVSPVLAPFLLLCLAPALMLF